MRKHRRLLVILTVFTLALWVAPAASADGDHPGITPEEVDVIVFPGQSVEIDKTVHTPELPPVLDVCLIVDLSGSYGNDLPNIKTLAPQIWDDLEAGVGDLRMGLASFVDFPFRNWGVAAAGDYAYSLDQQLTGEKATWVGAVDAMVTRNGGDGPESQYEALYQVATGAGNDVPPPGASLGDVAPGQECDFREDATKVAILTTDATFHDAGDGGGPFPYPGASEAATTAALVAGDIVVIGLKAPGAGTELDALAAATGGTTKPTTSTSSDIAEAILDALQEIEIEVSMTSDCAPPISTTFSPDSVTTTGLSHADFVETISVAADAPGGVYTCQDWALIDGEPMVDAEENIIYETKTVLVPENFVTGGGNISTGRGKNRVKELTFGGNAGYMADGSLVGQWNFNFHNLESRFHTTEITALQFVDSGGDPAPPEADADTAIMVATGRANFGDGWEDGCTLNVSFFDGGEPQEDRVFDVLITCPSGGVVGAAPLTGGNIQIHDGTK